MLEICTLLVMATSWMIIAVICWVQIIPCLVVAMSVLAELVVVVVMECDLDLIRLDHQGDLKIPRLVFNHRCVGLHLEDPVNQIRITCDHPTI